MFSCSKSILKGEKTSNFLIDENDVLRWKIAIITLECLNKREKTSNANGFQ